MKTMEQIINQIIEIELSARKIVGEAKDSLENLGSRAAAELDLLRNRQFQAVERQLETARAQDAENLTKKIDELNRHYENRLRALEAATKDNLDRWVDEIFSNITRVD